jgi:hypothetical protein
MQINGPYKFLCTKTEYVYGYTFKVPVPFNLQGLSQDSPHVARAFLEKDEKGGATVILDIKEIEHLPSYMDTPQLVYCGGQKCRVQGAGCWCVDCYGDEPNLNALLECNMDQDITVKEEEVLKQQQKKIGLLSKADLENEVKYLQELTTSYLSLLKENKK